MDDLEVMRKYPPLVKAYAKWVFPLINRLDWNFKTDQTGKPLPRLTNEEYNSYLFQRPKHSGMYNLTQTHIEEHLEATKTIYFRARGVRTLLQKGPPPVYDNTQRALIAIDIDAKAGCSITPEDAEETAKFIAKSIHRGAYYEKSTNGRGVHVFIVVDRGHFGLRKFRLFLKDLETSIRVLVSETGLRANIDRICGTPTIITTEPQPNGGVYRYIKDGDRGVCVKLPSLPDGFESLKRLQKAPVLSYKGIKWIIDRAAKRSVSHPKALPTTSIFTRPDSAPPIPLITSIPEIRRCPDAFTRMHHACNLFRLQYLRFAHNANELVSFYEANNFNTGIDKYNRRANRAEAVLTYQSRLLPDENACDNYHLNRYREMVEKCVTEEHHKGVKTDRKITNEDLAIVLYVIERNSLSVSNRENWQGTCGNQAIIGMFKSLREAGRTQRGCNLNKAVASKRILEAAGLVKCEDSKWTYAGPARGICKKYGLGEAHPMVEIYQTRQNARNESKEALARGMARAPEAVLQTLRAHNELDDIFEELQLVGDKVEVAAEAIVETPENLTRDVEIRTGSYHFNELVVEFDHAPVAVPESGIVPVESMVEFTDVKDIVADDPELLFWGDSS